MLKLDLYIKAFSALEQQSANLESSEVDTKRSYGTPSPLLALEPDYTNTIPPMQLRRMSKAVRMGIGAAKNCLEMAEISKPDAIIVGTAFGCLQDTENFLKKMVEQDEKMLTPTAFIQSTHNTIAGQIALGTQCMGYNNTISQHGHSFENALVAAALLLNEKPESNVLCGGVDELTQTAFHLMQRAGLFGEINSEKKSVAAGEGAGFLLLQKSNEAALACVRTIHSFTEKDIEKALAAVWESLKEQGFNEKANALWLGISAEDTMNLLPAEADEIQPHFFKGKTGQWGTVMATAICKAIQESPDNSRVFMVNNFCEDWSVVVLEML
ncbi:MAG: beta-ketoacyl synthase chain length factor [Chitinophagaceae bacterium]